MKNLVTQILMLLFTREITREIYVYYLHVVYVKRWKSSPSRGISLYPLTFSSNLKQKRKYYLYQFRESPCTKTEEERREERGRERVERRRNGTRRLPRIAFRILRALHTITMYVQFDFVSLAYQLVLINGARSFSTL